MALGVLKSPVSSSPVNFVELPKPAPFPKGVQCLGEVLCAAYAMAALNRKLLLTAIDNPFEIDWAAATEASGQFLDDVLLGNSPLAFHNTPR